MKIDGSAYEILSFHDDRRIALYLLEGDENLLIDSGFSFSPSKTILPYFADHDLSLQDVRWLVTTHASPDHCGGHAALKAQNPSIIAIAHRLEADAISNLDRFQAEHVDVLRTHQWYMQPLDVHSSDFQQYWAQGTPVDLTVDGSVRIRLADGWWVELLHLPGHTPGHIGVYDLLNDILYAGDAVMARGIPNMHDTIVMPPHYFEITTYLNTLDTLEKLSPATLLSTHYPPLYGDDVRQFLQESRAFVFECEQLLEAILASAQEPLSSLGIVARLRDRLGIPGADYQYGLLVRAHLNHLVRKRLATRYGNGDKYRWSVAKGGVA